MALQKLLKFTILSLAWLQVAASDAQTCSPPPTIQFGLRNCTFSAANQTDVQSWGVLLGVGGSTELCATPSTVVNSTLLQSSEVCSNDGLTVGNITMTAAQCRSRRGGYVIRQDLPTASTDGLDALNPGWVSLTKVDTPIPFQYAAQAALQIRDESVTMTEALITQGQQHTTSHIGLGEQSTLLQFLKKMGLIAARSWGLNSGSQSYLFPRDGSLVLGGYDESSVDGPFFNFTIAKPNLLNGRPCPLQISITDMTLKVSNGNDSVTQTKDFFSIANKLPACIEPYDNLFRLPSPNLKDVISMLAQVSASNDAPVDSSQYKGLYNLEPGLVYPSSAGAFSVSLEITIDNGLTVTIPSHELVRPLRGLDANGTQIVDTRFNEVQIYGSPAPEDGPVLGKAFLSQLYLFVDLESSEFHLAKQNLGANTPLPKSSASCPAVSTWTKPVVGLTVVGIILALLIVAAASYALYWWFMKKRVPEPATPVTSGEHENPPGLQEVPNDPQMRLLK